MEENPLSTLFEVPLEERAQERSRLEAFLSAPRSAQALRVWLAPCESRPTVEELVTQLTRDVAALDELIERQLNAVLHHPTFQKFESSWRGLAWLVDGVPRDADVKVRMLNVTWMELARDGERAIEFDQSHLFRKVYSAEFGSPGGEPFGILLGDYEVSHKPRPDQPVDDVRALRSIAQVAGAAFAPFVCSAHPTLLGLESFGELQAPMDLPRSFRGVEYTAWRSLRASEDSRFLAVTLPRMLIRAPYSHDPGRADGFPFSEHCRKHNDYLWTNACYAMGSVVVRAFANWGWLADIRGTKRGEESGGLVTGLPAPDHGLPGCRTDSEGVAVRFAAELVIADSQERTLSDLGFIALTAIPGESVHAFYTTPSLNESQRFDNPDATANARLAGMLQYVLCASRVAHFVKMLCRDMTGSFMSSDELQRRLSNWLHSITVASESASDEMQARFPLSQSSVTVREQPGRPGCFASVLQLCPHFQLDQMTSSMRLVTEFQTGR